MWENNVKVKINIMKKNLICIHLSDLLNFWLSCVYGHLVLHKQIKVEKDIIHFASSVDENEEWLTIGDFNQVISVNDKISFKNRTLQGAELIECLNIYKLSELPPKG